MRERDNYMLCCDCGYAFKEKTMFKKAYKNTAICLCRKCAKELVKDIERLKKDCTDIDKFARDICKKRVLNGNTIASFEDLQTYIKKQKSEAIKEFVEEFQYFILNENIEIVVPKCKDYESYINGANQFRYQINNGINNLVKKMKEVEE